MDISARFQTRTLPSLPPVTRVPWAEDRARHLTHPVCAANCVFCSSLKRFQRQTHPLVATDQGLHVGAERKAGEGGGLPSEKSATFPFPGVPEADAAVTERR